MGSLLVSGWGQWRLAGWCILILTALATAAQAGTGQTWLLRNGEEYFGTASRYDFASRELTITKADGKTFSFPARDLAFSAKLQLIDSPAFGEALKSYRPPFMPILTMSLGAVAALSLPAIIGLWSSAQLFGAAAAPAGHLGAFLKVLAVAALQATVWLVSALSFDGGQPLIPDTNADIVMTLTVIVVGLLAASLVVAFHYHRSFWKGMAITCLAGVFSGIVGTAMGLTSLYLATRVDYETLVTRAVFEPFALF
jgi:hypothetical protein